MKAKKENKVYDIDKSQAKIYMNQGFDVYNDDGSLFGYSATKTIKYSEHMQIVGELKAKLDNAEKALKAAEKKLADSDSK